MFRVGLTGGIGSGKSAAAERFKVLGVPVIDADQIAREIVQPGREAFQKTVALLGEDILNSEGSIDRSKVRQLVFSDKALRKQLEEIMHPIIRQEMLDQAENARGAYCILMIPLLIEANQLDLVDRVLVIDCQEQEQILRTSARDQVQAEQVKAILQSQASREQRLAIADDVIDNSGDLGELYAKVDALHGRYIQMIEPKPEMLSQQDEEEERSVALAKPDLQVTDLPGQVSTEAMPWLHSPEVLKNQLPDNQWQTYELPLNERIRILLRLETLFEELDYYSKGDTLADSRAAVRTFICLLNALNRPDIKTDLIKETERLKVALSKFTKMDGVDLKRLAQTQHYLTDLVQALRSFNGHFGQQLKKNELITAVKQRETIPGGPMIFDLPIYGHWLSLPFKRRHADLLEWAKEFELLRSATELVLGIVRESALARPESAAAGAFQLILDKTVTYQLIRVFVPADAPFFAEMSGGRHRFGIRFVEHPKSDEKAIQLKAPVDFHLCCCAI